MDDISKSLNIRPLEVALGDEDFDVEPTQLVEIEDGSDPFFDQAAEDAEMVRQNILKLLNDGADLFDDVKVVAKNTQDPEQYGAAARMFSELIRANKELMNVHKDIIGLKPAPVEQPTQQANNITNIMINGGANEIMALLAKQGIEPKKLKNSTEDDPDADK